MDLQVGNIGSFRNSGATRVLDTQEAPTSGATRVLDTQQANILHSTSSTPQILFSPASGHSWDYYEGFFPSRRIMELPSSKSASN